MTRLGYWLMVYFACAVFLIEVRRARDSAPRLLASQDDER